jgi:hypothetical protein
MVFIDMPAKAIDPISRARKEAGPHIVKSPANGRFVL